MLKSVLEDFPKADIDVSIVWIDMLPNDSAAAAAKSAKIFDDPRVRQFHDPRATRLAGKAFAHGLIREGAGVAWDIYMFYDKDARWDENPPKPIDYMHQLGGGRRADPDRFRTGEGLLSQLHDSMERSFPAEPDAAGDRGPDR